MSDSIYSHFLWVVNKVDIYQEELNLFYLFIKISYFLWDELFILLLVDLFEIILLISFHLVILMKAAWQVFESASPILHHFN
jgi:hypothetical protein